MMNSSAETERSNRADMLKDPYCTKNNEQCPCLARHSRRAGLLTIRIVGTFDVTPASFREGAFL